MTSDNANNASSSGTTSMTSPTRVGYDEQDEAVFLRQQAEDAKIAMQQTVADMQQTVKTAADIRALTKQYPWVVLGATAAAGFVTTAFLLSSTRSQGETASAPAAPAPKKGSSLSSFVMSSLMGMARSAVMSTITSLIHANAQAESDEEQAMPYTNPGRNPGEGRQVPIS